jgi:hypothetical protein
MPSRRFDITPRPARSAHPLWRKTYLWACSLIGAAICIAVLAAALAPSPGHHVQPVGGVLGTAGLLFAMWIGWYAHRVPLTPARHRQVKAGEADTRAISDAEARIRRRREALEIVRKNPVLATELRIGRPDLARSFDDGGLVDINHVPASVLAALPGMDAALAARIASTRAEVGGFSSVADVEVTLDLAPTALSAVKEVLICRPLY